MSDIFKNLWMNKENTDIVIYVGGQDIPVHSAVLCECSEVFAAMFRHHDMLGSSNETLRLEVTDFEKDTMESFLEFLYTGDVRNVDFDRALELLRASDEYQVGDLKTYCCNYLMWRVNGENVCQVLTSADICNAENLRACAMKYFCENFLSAGDFEAKRSMFEERSELLCDIIKGFIDQKKTEQPRSDGQRNNNNKRLRDE